MRIALLFAALLMVAGCGSEPVRDLPPAAEPPSSARREWPSTP